MTINQGATNLRRVLADPNGFVVAPGVYDGMSARMALAAGFDALYMVSMAVNLLVVPGLMITRKKRPEQELQLPSTDKQTWASVH
jgi:hypothetical protein